MRNARDAFAVVMCGGERAREARGGVKMIAAARDVGD